MKKHILTFFIILFLQMIFAKDARIFLKQVELEKIYTSKVTNFLDKMYDQSDYYVFSDVQLIEKEQEKALAESKKANKEAPKETPDPFGYTFIEGLGLDGGSLPTLPGSGVKGRTISKKENDDEYVMTGLRISVYLSEKIYNVESRETITNFVNTNIQEIRNCFDCFILDKMPGKDSSSSSKNAQAKSLQEAYERQTQAIESTLTSYEALRDSIKWSVFQEEQEALRSELQKMQELDNIEKTLLERQLDEATSAREFWEDQEARRNSLQRNLDSLKYANLIEIDKDYRSRQDELLDNITLDYEEAMQDRLDDADATEERLFGLLENNLTGTGGGIDMEVETWGSSSRFSFLSIIIIVILVCAVLGFILLKMNKKKVVYLKPKTPTPEPAVPQGYTAPPTESNANSDVIRSEVRSLRQSAVTMSAGQKEGASQIISDWLDESSDDDDENNTDNTDKEE